jgi:hypothetical protein
VGVLKPVPTAVAPDESESVADAVPLLAEVQLVADAFEWEVCFFVTLNPKRARGFHFLE